ncbi:hypothetical protein [Methylomagnum sp.]
MMSRQEHCKALDAAEARLILLREVAAGLDRHGAGDGSPARRVLAERLADETAAFVRLVRLDPGPLADRPAVVIRANPAPPEGSPLACWIKAGQLRTRANRAARLGFGAVARELNGKAEQEARWARALER